jgi:outer membrane protein assembly factor BamB
MRMTEFQRSVGSRLVASDASSGALRWSRGRSGAREDRLGNVQFRCAPLASGDNILALYDRDAELVLGRLNPADGQLRGETVLCGLPVDRLSAGAVQLMSVADGLILVPTRRGYLIAVDGESFEVRWASRYGRTPPPDIRSRWSATVNEFDPPDGWLPTPPIVAGATILLAADDADELVAFDRQGGRILWRRPRESFRYLVGAAGGTAWIVGESVEALNVETGVARWSAAIDEVSGRPALSGERLLIPTVSGLAVIDAATGEVVGNQPPPPGHAPLGNVLCVGGALFSIDEHDVRKYPDLEAGYEATRDALASSEDTVSASIRLAWLERLRGKPDAALAALDAIRDAALTDIPRRQHVRSLRVQVLLSLAADAAEEQAAAFLERAAGEATESTEMMAVALATADLAAKRGNALEAVTAYLDLGERHAARGTAPNESAATDGGSLVGTNGADRHLHDILRERINMTLESLDAAGRDRLGELVAARVRGAVDLRAYDLMALYADLQLLGTAGAEAAVRMGEWETEDERYEVAVGWYESVRADPRLASNEMLRARIAEACASLYLMPILDSPLTAMALREGLRSTAPPALPTGLDEKEIDRRRRERESMPAQVPIELIRVVDQDRPRPVQLAGSPPEWLDRRLLFATEDSRLVCHDLVTGHVAWEAITRLNRWLEPGVAPTPRAATLGRRAGEPPPPPPPLQAFCDGLVVVVRAEDGLLALGIATGRAIWYREMDQPAPESPDDPTEPLAGGDGLIAFIPRVGELEVVQIRTGRSMWRRQIRPTDAARLAIAHGRVLALSADGERIQVMNAADGEVAARLEFEQSPAPITPAVLDSIVCGPVGDEVVAYDIETGAERWRFAAREPIVDLLRASPDTLVVVGPVGRARALDAANGQVRLDVPRDTLGERIVDASVSAEVTVIAAESPRGALVLAGYRVTDGQQLWAKEFADDGAPMLPSGWMTDSPELLSVFFRKKQNLVLSILDRRTGRRVCDDWRSQTQEGATTAPLLERRPGRVVIGNGTQWWVYAAATKADSVGQL